MSSLPTKTPPHPANTTHRIHTMALEQHTRNTHKRQPSPPLFHLLRPLSPPSQRARKLLLACWPVLPFHPHSSTRRPQRAHAREREGDRELFIHTPTARTQHTQCTPRRRSWASNLARGFARALVSRAVMCIPFWRAKSTRRFIYDTLEVTRSN